MSGDSPQDFPDSTIFSGDLTDPAASDPQYADAPGQSLAPVPADPTPTKALVLLVVHASLRAQAQGIVSAVRVGLELDPVLNDIAMAFGPEIASTGLLKTATRGLARKVRGKFLAELPRWPVASTDQLVLGVVVVAPTQSQTSEILDSLTDSKEFATLPLLLRGLSLDGRSSFTDARIMALPPGSPTRTDEAILRLVQDQVSEAESDSGGRLSVDHLEAMTGVTPALTDLVVTTPPAAATSKTGTLRGAADNRYLVSTAGEPVEVVYLVVASGLESRPKHIRAREVELAVALDKALHERSSAPLGQTWVIQMGLTRQPIVVSGGGLTAASLSTPGSAHIDLTDEIERTSRTIEEVTASYARRGVPTTTLPIVVVIVPPLTTPGYRFRRAVARLGEASRTAWLLVAADDNDGLRKLPTDRVFRDKPDVVNEVTYYAFNQPVHIAPDTTTPDSLTHPVTTEEGSTP